MKVLILIQGEKREKYDDIVIIVEDGGMATIEFIDTKITADLYQDRITGMHEDIFEELGNGKMYYEDYEGEEFITKKMIDDTLNWLVFPAPAEDFDIEYKFYDKDTDIHKTACQFVINNMKINT